MLGSLNLDQMQPGDKCRVKLVKAREEVRQRLMDMGILPNVELQIERRAISGDPIWIRILGFQLALRREEAISVTVEKV